MTVTPILQSRMEKVPDHTATSHRVCVRARPPSWLTGNAAPNLGNMVKRFKSYRKYWKLVGYLGVWHYPLYLAYKATKTTVHNKRDVIPECVLRVSSKNNVQRTVQVSSIINCLFQEVRGRFPNPAGTHP